MLCILIVNILMKLVISLIGQKWWSCVNDSHGQLITFEEFLVSVIVLLSFNLLQCVTILMPVFV